MALTRVLTVNAGSSSLKLRVVEAGDSVPVSRDLEAGDHDGLRAFLHECGDVDGVAHRIVHGGLQFREPVRIDAAVRQALDTTTELAPLHNPPALDAVDTVAQALPHVPAVACFDTGFHSTIPAAASTYALPQRWRELGVRRYGFHGLAHSWASRRARALGAGPRHLSCHLGSGASLCAVLDGRSVDTTMGFTPLEGLVMATRSGSFDPGAVLWLLRRHGVPAPELEDALEHGSGLAALAGTKDMREVEQRAAAGEGNAQLALDVYMQRLAGLMAEMVVSLGGVDVITFSGGVGEHSATVRARACERLAFCGVQLDASANAHAAPEQELGTGDVRVMVVTAREELEMARLALGLLT